MVPLIVSVAVAPRPASNDTVVETTPPFIVHAATNDPVPLAQLVKMNPAGRASVISTLVAPMSPRLATVTTYDDAAPAPSDATPSFLVTPTAG